MNKQEEMFEYIDKKIDDLNKLAIEKEKCFQERIIKLFIKKLTLSCSKRFKIGKNKVRPIIRNRVKKFLDDKYIIIYAKNEKIYYLRKNDKDIITINNRIFEVRKGVLYDKFS